MREDEPEAQEHRFYRQETSFIPSREAGVVAGWWLDTIVPG